MKTREQIVREAWRIRTEITQYFSDIEHWNATRPTERILDPDPDWKLKRMAAGIDAMLKKEIPVPHGFDALCWMCGAPYTFQNAKACDTKDWRKFCSKICQDSCKQIMDVDA